MNMHRSATPGFTRRRIVGAGLAGAALSVGANRVAATPPEPTPPQEPSDADLELLAFAMAIELAAHDLYREAVGNGLKVGEKINLLAVIADDHNQYADLLAGMLGVSAGGARSEDLFNEWSPRFSNTDLELFAADAHDFEAVLVATHSDLLGEIEGLRAAEIVASILVVEARHGAVLADVAGESADLDAVLETTAQPVSPDVATEGSS